MKPSSQVRPDPVTVLGVCPDPGAERRHAQADLRLHRHADYQRVYQSSRKQFSSFMTYFFARREEPGMPSRVGITAGRVLGKAVERNRIKRRLRPVIRQQAALLPLGVDVVLHPRRTVLTVEHEKLVAEIGRIFSTVCKSLEKSR